MKKASSKEERKIIFAAFIVCYVPDISLSVPYLFWSLLQYYFPGEQIELKEINKFAQSTLLEYEKLGNWEFLLITAGSSYLPEEHKLCTAINSVCRMVIFFTP